MGNDPPQTTRRGLILTRWTEPGGGRELLRLALPLILSNSVWTVQVTFDRILLSRLGPETVGAAMASIMLLWTPLALFQATANYATTFVAQYVGAGRPQRVGPVIWQAFYFSILSGAAFLALVPCCEWLVSLGGHSPTAQALEANYLRCLFFAAPPTLIVAATTSFFAGRGDSWTVLLINALGLAVNGVLSYLLIFGVAGFPRLEIAGAGWAMVGGTSASAVVSILLLLRRRYREEFAMLSWRPDLQLMRRLLRFGLPSGVQLSLDALAFTCFLMLVGQLGDVELAASSITFTVNLFAFFPAMGLAQGVAVLVGQRLGQDRANLAERTTWTGLHLGWLYMTAVALLYFLTPGLFVALFHAEGDTLRGARVEAMVTVLLRFVALYSLFDSINLMFAFALKGAGDTRFVTLVSLALAWPLMVLPTWAAAHFGWGVYWAFAFASAYIISLAAIFLVRFRGGRWRSMRVIEPERQPEPSPTLEETDSLVR